VEASQQAEDQQAGAEKRLEVTVHNEHDGESYTLHVTEREKLAKAIVHLYKDKLRVERQPDDRLRCETDGDDVFQFEELTFREYLAAGALLCAGLAVRGRDRRRLTGVMQLTEVDPEVAAGGVRRGSRRSVERWAPGASRSWTHPPWSPH
jgi:hypothetical protein